MKALYALLVVALLTGFASGPSSLESAALASPPIQWGSLSFVAAGSAFAIAFVLGIQAALGNSKALRWGWLFFLTAAVYVTGAGISALVVAASGPEVRPHAFLYLCLGSGILVGLGIVRFLFLRRFGS